MLVKPFCDRPTVVIFSKSPNSCLIRCLLAGWSRDMTGAIAEELGKRCAEFVPVSLRDFLDAHSRNRQRTAPRNHLGRDARGRRARSVDLLQRLPLQSLNTAAIDGPINNRLSDLERRIYLPGLRQASRRCAARLAFG